jgi:1,4-dihydroxy-2-naphthoate polyprenyltransferase
MSIAVSPSIGLRSVAGFLAALARLARLRFLFQSLMITGFGVALAFYATYRFSMLMYLLILGFGWSTHLMTHFCNEYFDLEADRANPAPTAWTGGSRVLVEGLLKPVVSISAAFVMLFISMFLIVLMRSLPAQLLAFAAVVLGWFYTAPPFRLNYHALGELTCSTVAYGLGPLLTGYLQAGYIPPVLWWCTGIVCALQVMRCLVMNLADLPGDRAVGKTTLAGILGPRIMTYSYITGQTVLYLGIVTLAVLGYLPLTVAMAQLAGVPVAVFVIRRLRADALSITASANAAAFWASQQLVFTTCLTTVALLVDTALHGRPLPVALLVVAAVCALVFAVWLVPAARAARITKPALSKPASASG